MIIYLAIMVLMGYIGGRIGKPKGRETQGWVLGALLGLIGVFIIGCMKPRPEALAAPQHQALRP